MDELAALQIENTRLITLLESHGINWRLPPEPEPPPPKPETTRFSKAEKLALFRRLFRGREDVYPVRWEGKTSGKTGYAPACANEWLAGVCGKPRMKCGECGNRVFLPLTDSVVYEHLAGKRSIGVYPMLPEATGGVHPLDVSFINEEDLATPWVRPAGAVRKLSGPMPAALTITQANLIYFEKASLPQPLANRLIRLAAFQNPEFYKAQAMRMSVWDIPRVIGCAENYPQHIGLPRGCLEAAQALLREQDIRCDLHDERFAGERLDVGFVGELRLDQEMAVSGMLGHDTGVLCAPTAFGKTVTAAALIARRGVNTLVLVHRTELLRQWQERLQAFLGVGKGVVGSIGGGKARPTGKIDIAVMQSLYRQGELNPLVENYGQVIVDECHHVSAVSFEAILKGVKARYLLGLTATPIRRDGQQPIIFMQCGPIRYRAAKPETAPHDLEVVPRIMEKTIELPASAGIQDVFRHLACDAERTTAIARDISTAFAEGRKVLVLTERTEHLDAILVSLADKVDSVFVLHGRLSKRQRATLIQELDALLLDAPRVLLATGKLVGEGFDHPPLDTLVLAMPISWKGTLQQYAGRLHREHATKTNVRIIDYVDAGHPTLLRMWDKRHRGYRAMGYRIAGESQHTLKGIEP